MEEPTIRILLADDNRRFSESLRQNLDSVDGFEVVGVAHDGVEAVRMTRELAPDLLVLDIIMPLLDGLGVLEQIRDGQLEKLPRIVVLSGMGQDGIAAMALSLGADYYMLKPFDVDMLVKRLKSLMGDQMPADFSAATVRQRDQYVLTLLGQLSMPPNINGYQYLREAVNLVSADASLLRGLTNKLYPRLAETFSSTPSRIERSIRHAIEITANKENREAFNRFFSNSSLQHREKPTNGEFIATLAELVRTYMQ